MFFRVVGEKVFAGEEGIGLFKSGGNGVKNGEIKINRTV